jgi:hypothetical protein
MLRATKLSIWYKVSTTKNKTLKGGEFNAKIDENFYVFSPAYAVGY